MPATSVRNARYIVVLAIASLAILAIGTSVQRAIDTGQPQPPAPSESDLLRLARLSHRRSLEDMAGYFGAIAGQVQRSMVPLHTLDATGVLWPDGVVVTAGWGHAIDGAELSGPHMPLIALAPEEKRAEPAVLRADTELRPGEWIVAAWRRGGERAYEAGNVAGTATVACREQSVREVLTTFALTRSMAGAGVFDVDGRLVAVILPCDEGLAAVAVADINAMLKTGRTDEGRMLATFGLRVSDLTVDETAYFKRPQAVLVREIWEGFRAAQADLRPGDIVRAANDRSVTTPEELQRLLLSERGGLVVKVERRGRLVTIALPRDASQAAPSEKGPGIVWTSSVDGYPIEAVRPESPASRAGVRAGDTVLRIDLIAPRNLTEVQRRLAAGSPTRPAFLELQRGRRRWGVLLR